MSQLVLLENQAITLIKSKLEADHFNVIDLCSEDDIDEQTDKFCDLPVLTISSDGYYSEYRVIRLSLDEDKEIHLHCHGYGENIGAETSAMLTEGYLPSNELLRLADLLN